MSLIMFLQFRLKLNVLGHGTALPPISKLKNIEFHNIIVVHICSYYVTPSPTIPDYKIYINAYFLTLTESFQKCLCGSACC